MRTQPHCPAKRTSTVKSTKKRKFRGLTETVKAQSIQYVLLHRGGIKPVCTGLQRSHHPIPNGLTLQRCSYATIPILAKFFIWLSVTSRYCFLLVTPRGIRTCAFGWCVARLESQVRESHVIVSGARDPSVVKSTILIVVIGASWMITPHDYFGCQSYPGMQSARCIRKRATSDPCSYHPDHERTRPLDSYDCRHCETRFKSPTAADILRSYRRSSPEL